MRAVNRTKAITGRGVIADQQDNHYGFKQEVGSWFGCWRPVTDPTTGETLDECTNVLICHATKQLAPLLM